MNCNCKGWQEGHEQVVAAWAFCANHSGGPIYTGPIGRFCHWCGACLRRQERLGEDGEPGVGSRATQAKKLLTDLATDLEKAADSVYRQQAARLRFAARAERLLGELVRVGGKKCKP